MPNCLTILGSSSALPTSERFSTAQVLQMLGRYFLIDCGEGTQIQLRRAKSPFSKINNIFISHLHGDHYFGIFGLLSSFSMLGRKHPVHIYGPPQLQEIINYQTQFFGENLGFTIEYIATDPQNGMQLLFEDRKMEVYAFPLKHRAPTTGFLFKEKAKVPNIRKEAIEKYGLDISEIAAIKSGSELRLEDGTVIPNEDLVLQPPAPLSYAFCSDTAFSLKTAEYVHGASLLYHESTFTDEMLPRAKQTLHSTARQAAEIATAAGVQKLIIGHFSARYRDLNVFISEAKPYFPNTYLAEDMRSFEF